MYIYKNNNNWVVGNNVNSFCPSGVYSLETSGNQYIHLIPIAHNTAIDFGNVLITDVKKNSAGDFYLSVDEFIATAVDFFVDAAQVAAGQLDTRLTYVEQHAYDTLWIDSWQVEQPTTPFVGQVWFNTTDTVKAWDGTLWNTIPISFYKLYVKDSAPTREIYSWSGSTMVAISVPLTRASIEAIMGDRTVAMSAYNIDLNTGEKFTKTCGTSSAFTITNPILDKAFRLVITGGTLATTLFTSYTSNWLLGAVITDYTPANINYLWCEIRSTGQIYLFWGE